MNRGIGFIFCCLIPFFINSLSGCGGGSGDEEAFAEPAGTGDDSGSDGSDDETVNTEKLVGTPFKGLTYGDDFNETFFLCDQYRTETIDAFPIQIFAAMFWRADEEYIQEGIDVANEAVGFQAYELTDTWSDDIRVMYAVSEGSLGEGVGGQAYAVYLSFNGTQYAEVQAPDWAIALEKDTGAFISPKTVAHELGHATAIQNHALIDYENDTFTELEENSIMSHGGSIQVLTDYTYMMIRQGQIMQDHLGEVGDFVGGWECDE